MARFSVADDALDGSCGPAATGRRATRRAQAVQPEL
jgi:hypothetical protein